MTQHDIKVLKEMKGKFAEAERVTGIDKSLIGAVASRESNGGLTLDKNGCGDHGNGYGIMQVDKRHHTIDKSGPASQAHINQGATILKQSIDGVTKKHPGWPRDKQIQGGIAAYNFGVKNVQTIGGIDKGTTGGNYSSDVLKRQQYLKDHGF